MSITPVPKPQKIEKLEKRLLKLKEQKEKQVKNLKERLKKKPKKKPSQPSMKSLRDKSWKLLSKIVREEEGYVCYTCGKNMSQDKSSCDAGHFVPRGKVSALRYDRRNVHAQCDQCNRYLSGNLSVYAVRLERQYGFGILQEFDRIRDEENQMHKDKVKPKVNDRFVLMEMIQKFTSQLALLEAQNVR